MKKKFIEAVEEGDLNRVRLFLSNELLLDPRGDSYDEMKAFAESKFPDLYVADNGERFVIPEADWSKDHLFKIKNDLDSNFSIERLSYYESVAKTVLKEKASNLDREAALTKIVKHTEGDNSGSNNSSIQDKKIVYSTIAAGGAIIAIAGVSMSKMGLAALGLAGVVVGGILLYNQSKR